MIAISQPIDNQRRFNPDRTQASVLSNYALVVAVPRATPLVSAKISREVARSDQHIRKYFRRRTDRMIPRQHRKLKSELVLCVRPEIGH